MPLPRRSRLDSRPGRSTVATPAGPAGTAAGAARGATPTCGSTKSVAGAGVLFAGRLGATGGSIRRSLRQACTVSGRRPLWALCFSQRATLGLSRSWLARYSRKVVRSASMSVSPTMNWPSASLSSRGGALPGPAAAAGAGAGTPGAAGGTFRKSLPSRLARCAMSFTSWALVAALMSARLSSQPCRSRASSSKNVSSSSKRRFQSIGVAFMT